jgi:hypothetical protein
MTNAWRIQVRAVLSAVGVAAMLIMSVAAPVWAKLPYLDGRVRALASPSPASNHAGPRVADLGGRGQDCPGAFRLGSVARRLARLAYGGRHLLLTSWSPQVRGERRPSGATWSYCWLVRGPWSPSRTGPGGRRPRSHPAIPTRWPSRSVRDGLAGDDVDDRSDGGRHRGHPLCPRASLRAPRRVSTLRRPDRG